MMTPLPAHQIRNFREAATNNGYRVIRVRSRSKVPAALGWQRGEDLATLTACTDEAANTGLLCAGLRVVDIDVDDPLLVQGIAGLLSIHLPKGALIRRRKSSPRLALIYRADFGEPAKRAISGTGGKVEVHGQGQQLVVFGQHPSGDNLDWFKDRSPATVPLADLPVVTEESITNFLAACCHLIGAADAAVTCTGNRGEPLTVNSDELTAGIGAGWFHDLSPTQQKSLVSACLDAIDNRTNDPRDLWRDVLFAAADAEANGCTDARELALSWSRRGAGWTDEAAFDRVWNSCKPGGVTLGTLIYLGQKNGIDVSTFTKHPIEPTGLSTLRKQAMSVAQLPQIPQKRHWLHGTDVIRGAVSLMVAPGARGKSSWLLMLALACTSGKPLLGSHVFGGQLQVLYINAEDSTAEISRRLRAAMAHHGLADADVPGLFVAGVDQLSLTLLNQDKHQPCLLKSGWDTLAREIERIHPDIVIIDPLLSVTGGVSLNDNAAAALLIGRLTKLSAEHNLGIVVAHHAAKYRETNSADAAMGAASLVNLSRNSMSLEPLNEKEAAALSVAPWDAGSIFRVISTKHNLSPTGTNDRWFRTVSVDLNNAEPPVYPHGDKVGVVELFVPNPSTPAFPAGMITAALAAVAAASPPLAARGRPNGISAAAVVAAAITPAKGALATEADGKALIQYLIKTGAIYLAQVSVPRQGRGAYKREALLVSGGVMPGPSQQTP